MIFCCIQMKLFRIPSEFAKMSVYVSMYKQEGRHHLELIKYIYHIFFSLPTYRCARFKPAHLVILV